MATRSISTAIYDILGYPANPWMDILLLILLWFLASWTWLLGFHLIPHDSITFFYPQTRFVVDSLRLGDLPWWNPYQFSGMPVLGDPQGMLFTLHSLIGLIFGESFNLTVFDIITLLHLLLGSFFVYAIGYSQKVPRVWLLMAALVFMLGGVSTGRLQHMSQIVSYSWLPVLLWILLLLARRPYKSLAVLFGLALAFWAANPNQVVFLGSILLGAIGLHKVVRPVFDVRLLTLYMLAAGVMIATVAPIYSAILEVIEISQRAALTLEHSSWSSFPWHVFLSLFMPGLYGNLGGQVWSPTDLTQDYFYIGILPIISFALAFYITRFWRKPIAWFWSLGLLLFILFSIGVNSPFYPFLWNNVPGFDFFRRPADGAYFINFLLALGLILVGREIALAPSGFAECANSSRAQWRSAYKYFFLSTVILSLPLIGFAVGAEAGSRDALQVLFRSYGELIVRIAIFVAFVLGSLMMVVRFQKLVPIVITSALLLVTLDISLSGRWFGRFSVPYLSHPLGPSYQATVDPADQSIDQWLRANTAPGKRVEVVGGIKASGHSSKVQWYNTQGSNPIKLSNYTKIIGAYETISQPRWFPHDSNGSMDWRYDVLGVRYVAFYNGTLNSGIDHPANEQARRYLSTLTQNGASQVYNDGQYQVWERPGVNLWLALAESPRPGDLAPAPCQLKKYGNVEVEIDCALDKPARLVIGEIHAPGWAACVNDSWTRIEPYHDLFRSVDLPAGQSHLQLKYQPIPLLRFKSC